jgi:hypothetical protein
MLGLVRRDPATRMLPIWALIVGLSVSFLMGALLLRSLRSQSPVSAFSLIALGWTGVSVYLLFGRVRTRCSEFDLTLPIDARRLWLGHLLSVLTAGALIVLTIMLVVIAHEVLPARVELELGPAGLAAYLLGGLFLAVALLEAHAPPLASVPLSRAYVGRTVTVLAGVFALLLLLPAGRLVWSLVPVAVALVVAVRAYRSLPSAFTVVPAEPWADSSRETPSVAGERAQRKGESPRAAEGEAGEMAVPARWIVWTTAVRTVSAGFKDLIGIPLIAVVAVLFGGVFDLAGPESDLQFLPYTYLPMATYLLLALFPLRLARLHHVDSLPLSRRLLFAVATLPLVAAVAAGYGAGYVASRVFDTRPELVRYEQTRDGFRIGVPVRFLEIARDGAPPVVGSPWGETFAPSGTALHQWGRAVAYSPFAVGKESSLEFVALQISRAAGAVYGAEIPYRQIAERYLRVSPDGIVVAKESGLTLRADFPDLEPRGAGPRFAATMTIVTLPWLLLVAALLLCYRSGVPNALRLSIYWGSLGLMLSLLIFLFVAMVTGLTAPWFTQAAFQIPVQWLGHSPARAAGTWAIGGLLLAGAYFLAESRFRRMEIPLRPPKYSLIDCL